MNGARSRSSQKRELEMPGMTALSVNVGGTASRRGNDPHACSKTPTTTAAAIRAIGIDVNTAPPGQGFRILVPFPPKRLETLPPLSVVTIATIEAERASAVRHQQQEATGDRDVLEEHDHLDL